MRVCVVALGALHADYSAFESSEALEGRLTVKKPQDGAAVWPLIVETIQSANYDLVILEELGDAVQQGTVNPEDAVKLLSSESLTGHVFATGASFPDALMRRADLVTEAKCV
jgi:ATP:corrinoid adenosyltransferase